jgi:endonuclease-3
MKDRVMKILDTLESEYSDIKGTSLHWRNPLELLVATILSAQSTDVKVNEVTETLFEKYQTAEDYATAPRKGLEEDIRPTGFYHQKAGWIQEACRTLVEEHGGEIPRSMEALIGLKGVARKTANIVLQNAYGVVEGVAVDTHVMRLSKRLGLTAERYRDKIERDLMEVAPRSKWFAINYLLIEHGRNICTARKPDCEKCAIDELCPSAFTFPHNRPS